MLGPFRCVTPSIRMSSCFIARQAPSGAVRYDRGQRYYNAFRAGHCAECPRHAPFRPQLPMIADPAPPNLPQTPSTTRWRAVLADLLQPGEEVVARLETDLDERLDFADGLLVLTRQRFIGLTPSAPSQPQVVPLAPDLRLTHQDHAGVGRLTLTDASARLGVWRYTLAKAPQALALE